MSGTTRGLQGFALSFVVAVTVLPERAAAEPCSEVDKPVAETGASWDALHSHFVRFVTKCGDDGAVYEGNSEAVLSLLDGSWNTLPRLAELTRRDTRFQAFVLRHVDDLMDYDTLRRIRDHAKTACPRDLSALCLRIADAAEGILAKAAPK